MGSRLTLTGDCLEGLAPLTGAQRNPLDLINRNWNELLNLISILLLNSPNLDLMSYLQINKCTLQLNSLTPCLTCLFLFPSLWLWVLCQLGLSPLVAVPPRMVYWNYGMYLLDSSFNVHNVHWILSSKRNYRGKLSSRSDPSQFTLGRYDLS